MENQKKKGLLGFGDPIVDEVFQVPCEFLEESGIAPGGSPGAHPVFIKKLFEHYQASFSGCGGSMSNVCKAISMLGYRGGFAGACSNDENHQVVVDGLKKFGVETLLAVKPGHTTSRVIACVHPDSNRTFFGIFDNELWLTVKDVNWEEVAGYECLAFEGYFMKDNDNAEIVDYVYKFARENDQKILIVLSDIFWSPRYKDRALEAAQKASFISGTEGEFKQLFDKKERQEVLDQLVTMDYDLCAMTMGAEGAYVIQKDKYYFIPCEKNITAVDTTGAGDYFSAGMLFAHFNGYGPETCGKVGAMFGASVVTKWGNVPDLEVVDRIHEYLKTQKKVSE